MVNIFKELKTYDKILRKFWFNSDKIYVIVTIGVYFPIKIGVAEDKNLYKLVGYEFTS